MPTIYLALLLCLPLVFFITRKKSSKRLPPGSFGMPIIGQSFEFIQAMRANKCEEWLQQRFKTYGPIFKLHLFGTPAVFLNGQAANKFIYTSDERILTNQQPASVRRLFGERNILELSGEDHKRIRGAMVSFLKPDALKQSVGRMSEEIQLHLKKHWHDGQEIKVMPLMKTLTFDMICSLLFGIERGERRETLVNLCVLVTSGLLSLPLNFPFTRFNKGLRARSKIRDIILDLMREKRAKLETSVLPGHQDLITSLFSMRDEMDSPLLSDEEIVDNSVSAMVAGFESTSVLLSFFIKMLAENRNVYENVLHEHEEIARGKASNELLTWEDLARMKYTWRVATELMRMTPPVLFLSRKVLQEFEIGEYVIPKGWQVMWSGCMTHMDESIFPDPLKFDPSRFENPGEIPPYSLIHFGAGRKICPGYEFVRIETLTMIHYLVTGFQWKLCLEENSVSRNPFPVFNEGLPIVVELKKPSHDEK